MDEDFIVSSIFLFLDEYMLNLVQSPISNLCKSKTSPKSYKPSDKPKVAKSCSRSLLVSRYILSPPKSSEYSLTLMNCSLRKTYRLYDNSCDCVPSVSSRTCLTTISRTRRSAVWYVYLLINNRKLCELVGRSWSR